MESFTEVYDKSRNLLTSKCFEKGWPDAQSKLQPLFAPDGPARAQFDVLRWFRVSLEAKFVWGPAGERHPRTDAQMVADAIIDICKDSIKGTSHKLADVVALVKMLKHFYHVRAIGTQSIWIVDNPKRYDKWAYDLFAGKSEGQLRDLLMSDDEFFGEANRKLIADSFEWAKKWSSDVEHRLTYADLPTREIVKRWFLSKDASDAEVQGMAHRLLSGFFDMNRLFDSNTIIFCDEPAERKDAELNHWAAEVDVKERLFSVTLSQGFINELTEPPPTRGIFHHPYPKLYWAALLLIHEFSHRALNTDDTAAGTTQPGDPFFGRTFSPLEAQANAQSWANFATELVGFRPPPLKPL